MGKTAHQAFKRARSEEPYNSNYCLTRVMFIAREIICGLNEELPVHVLSALSPHGGHTQISSSLAV